ncbi:MAG TPA: hypothetical protein VF800_12565 [Telluria sp.]|jgi:hypothetical protein
MKNIFLILGVAFVFTGCASLKHQPLDAAAAASLKDKPVAQTARKLPDFASMTAGKAVFGMLGAMAMISEGNGIIKDNNVPDPADAIARELAAALSSAHGAKLGASAVSVSADDADAVAAAAGSTARFVVDVQTINWSIVYFPTNWTHYRLIYTAKARLIDTESKKVIAESFCTRVPNETPDSPSYDQLVGNGAAGLKKELGLAGNECLATMKEKMLAL